MWQAAGHARLLALLLDGSNARCLSMTRAMHSSSINYSSCANSSWSSISQQQQPQQQQQQQAQQQVQQQVQQAQQQQAQQRRFCSSLAAASAAPAHAAAATPLRQHAAAQLSQVQVDLVDYERRLQEMRTHGTHLAQQQQQQQRPAQQPAASRRQLLDLSQVPPLNVPRRRSPAANQPLGPGQDGSSTPAVDWQEVLRRAREAGLLTPTGPQALTDSFRRMHTYLRISLTERCNLRCTYCMPADGVALTPQPQLLSAAELERLARLFVRAGVTKVRLTGGEPTVRRDLVDIVRSLNGLREEGLRTIAMTSNGLTLAKTLPALLDAGLSPSGLNISLDSLRPERFEAMTRRRGHDRVLSAIRAAVDAGCDPVKVNVVVMRGINDDEVADFVELTRHDPVNVRFIEYMPFDGNVWSTNKMVPYRELMAAIAARYPAGLERLDDPSGEVAKNFRLPGFRGSVSFITSMTHAFCGDCNRLRLLADGALKVCLFGASEVSLRDALRGGASDDELLAVIGAAVANKKAAHAGMEVLAVTQNRPMITIGG